MTGFTTRVRQAMAVIGRRRNTDHNHLPVGPLFDPLWYLRQYPDVAAARVDPLDHYMKRGAGEGRNPHPLFDTDWYLATHPDIAATGTNPLAHYVTTGAALGYDPHPLFDTDWYLATYPDIAATGFNPLAHYVTTGAALGYDPHPLFDTDWYLATYPDIAATGFNPLAHYLQVGWQQGKNPSPAFDTRWYLNEYPDVAAADLEPLYHFVVQGGPEGRYPRRIDQWTHSIGPPGFGDELRRDSDTPVRVAILVPVYGQWHLTDRCLRALAASEVRTKAQVIVIDDAGPEDELGVMGRHPWALHRRLKHQVGFVRAINAEAQLSTADYFLLLHNDTEPLPGFLDVLIDRMLRETDTAIAGSQLIHANGAVQEAGSIIWADGSVAQVGANSHLGDHRLDYSREVDSCSGTAILVRGNFWRTNAGFDKTYPTDLHAVVDLALAARSSGWRVVYEPRSIVVHHQAHGPERSSSREARQIISQKQLSDQWAKELRDAALPDELPLDVAASSDRRRVIAIVREEVLTPERDAGSLRMARLIDAWELLGYRVALIAPHQDRYSAAAVAIRSRGVELVTEPAEILGFLQRNREWIACIVYSHVSAMWTWHRRFRRKARGIPVVFDTVDVHHLREMAQAELFDDPLGRVRAERTKAREMWCVDTADATLVVSEGEQAYLRAELPDADVRVVSIIHPDPVEGSPWGERRGLVFIGYFEHTPNLDGITWFLDQVWPLLPEEIRADGLEIIGTPTPLGLSHRALPGVTVRGWVRNTEPFLDAARLSIAPLRYGSGVKGKVAEAWSRGLPVAGTRVALDGMSKDYPRASNAVDLAQLLTSLYGDEERWIAARDAGAHEIRSRFSREAARRALELLQRDLDLGRETGDKQKTLADGRLTPWLLPGWPIDGALPGGHAFGSSD